MQSRFSRRVMLQDGLLTVGAQLAVPGIFSAMATAPSAMGAAVQAVTAGKILVVVQIAGGLDGLHAVIPYRDPLYPKLRPNLAVDSKQVVPLTNDLGLHTGLNPLKPLWDAKQMAIIENVGYPQANLSHFQSMYIWQTLDMSGEQGSSQSGWLGRYLASVGGNTASPFAGLCEGVEIAPEMMAANAAIAAIGDPAAFTVQGDRSAPERDDERTQRLLQFYQESGNTRFAPYLGNLAKATVNAAQQFQSAVTAYQPAATYPQTALGEGLQLIATAITQGLPMRVGHVIIGGFDTHVEQKTVLAGLYPDLAGSIAAFWQDLTAHGVADNVLMMTWSEFGRRVTENGSAGTDHGAAAPLFVFGPGVNGGIYGDAPDLKNLDVDHSLVFKTDFRSVYATVLDKWMGTDANSILGQKFTPLAFLRG
ncbi:MAG: DUF1501 domain-containing protein [Ktedonobacterales bacterium]|nr:DUF1501 domain-containing protein [Ktedonobacterales bacterium]